MTREALRSTEASTARATPQPIGEEEDDRGSEHAYHETGDPRDHRSSQAEDQGDSRHSRMQRLRWEEGRQSPLTRIRRDLDTGENEHGPSRLLRINALRLQRRPGQRHSVE